VTEHRWLGYRDGTCAEVPPSDAVPQLCALIEEVAPDTVLTFGPDGFTGHPDHQVVSAWVSSAFDRVAPAGTRLLHAAFPERRVQRWSELDASLDVYSPGYPVVVADDDLAVHLALPPATLARKVSALRAQETQTAGLIAAMGLDVYTAWVAEEAFAEPPRRAPVAAGSAARVMTG
jgi:LmbE family N-acetylglucosaminyl deacetylase